MEKKKHKMRKIIGWTLFAALVLFLVYLFFPTSYERNNFERLKGMDLEATLSRQQAAEKKLGAPKNMKTSQIDIKYISIADTIATRRMWLYMPTDVKQPVPVVYIPHYSMSATSPDLRQYIAEGWAVAAPVDEPGKPTGEIYEDDLVFNNAALYTLRHLPSIDKQHILLCGGSAGGYTTLMLDALQMGITASVGNGPVPNVYYNVCQHFGTRAAKANSFWQLRSKVRTILGFIFSKNKMEALIKGKFQLPIPWVGMLSGSDREKTKDPAYMNYKRWEPVSPVALTACFSSPFLTNHGTSDMLVPLNQTDDQHLRGLGKTIPKGFSLDLDRNIPGPLGHTFVEMLPKELTRVYVLDASNPDKDVVSQYDTTAMFNINIADNGPVEAYGDHSSAPKGKGQQIYIGYMKAMMQQGLARTERLMPGKLLLLLDRYQGKSTQLPAHRGIDDTVYGSLAIYQKEVVDELATYAQNHSMAELEQGIHSAIATAKAPARQQYNQTWIEIKNKIK